MTDAAAESGGPNEEAATASLVKAAQSGDSAAFGILYGRFGSLVHGVLLAHAPLDEVPDLVHDVFLHAMARLSSLRDPMAFGAWLSQIARNMARMKSRSGLRLVPLDDSIAATPDSAEVGLDADRVLAALRSLPESYRETLVMRLVEGMSGAQISERTGLTPGSVRVNLHRGMQMLRQKLGGTR